MAATAATALNSDTPTMDALFDAAAAAVYSLPRGGGSASPSAPTESAKLMLYGLYKQVTLGASPVLSLSSACLARWPARSSPSMRYCPPAFLPVPCGMPSLSHTPPLSLSLRALYQTRAVGL